MKYGLSAYELARNFFEIYVQLHNKKEDWESLSPFKKDLLIRTFEKLVDKLK